MSKKQKMKPIWVYSPWTVSVNDMYVKGRIKSDKYRAYLQDLEYWLLKQGLPKFRTTDPIQARNFFFPPNNLVRDIDNPNKTLFDGYKSKSVIIDDRYIKKLIVTFCPPVERGAIITEFSLYDPSEDEQEEVKALMSRFHLTPYLTQKQKAKLRRKTK